MDSGLKESKHGLTVVVSSLAAHWLTLHFDRDPQIGRSNLSFVELPYVRNFLFKLIEGFMTGQT